MALQPVLIGWAAVIWSCECSTARCQTSSESSPVELLGTAVRRSPSPAEGFTVHVWLRNSSQSPLLLEDVVLTARSDGGAAPRAIALQWARLHPPGIAPRGLGELIVRSREVIAPGDDLRLRALTSQGPLQVETTVTVPEITLLAVNPSPSLDVVYVYAANAGPRPFTPTPILLSDRPADPAMRRVNWPIPPGDVGCCALRLARPLTAGQVIGVKISMSPPAGPEAVAGAVIRACGDLPIFGIPYVSRSPVAGAKGASSRGPQPPPVRLPANHCYLIECLAHAFGSLEQGAAECVSRALGQWQADPRALGITHICRMYSPQSYYDLGMLSDVALINVSMPISRPAPDRDKPPTVAEQYLYWCRHAYLATRPYRLYSTVWLVPGDEKDKRPRSAAEVRLRLWCSLASGAKGIAFHGWAIDPQIAQTVCDVLDDAKPWLGLLAIAEPVAWASVDRPGLTVRSALCGTRAVLVVAFNACPAGDWELVTPPPPARARIRVRKVPGFRATRVVGLTPGSDARMRDDERDYVIEATVVESAEAFLLLDSGSAQ